MQRVACSCVRALVMCGVQSCCLGLLKKHHRHAGGRPNRAWKTSQVTATAPDALPDLCFNTRYDRQTIRKPDKAPQTRVTRPGLRAIESTRNSKGKIEIESGDAADGALLGSTVNASVSCILT